MYFTHYEAKETVLDFLKGAVKGAVTDMRYFARSKFSRSIVHKKILAWYDK